MGELEDRISSVLNDPEQFGRIAAMAKSIMGGEEARSGSETLPDGETLGKLKKMLGGEGGAASQSLKMLEALKPCLSEKRQKKMEKALTLARLARFAGFAVKETEDGNV